MPEPGWLDRQFKSIKESMETWPSWMKQTEETKQMSSPMDFVFNDSVPQRFIVRDTTNPTSMTRSYSIIADYGWAETIVCSGSSLKDANSIARILSAELGITCMLLVYIPEKGNRK